MSRADAPSFCCRNTFIHQSRFTVRKESRFCSSGSGLRAQSGYSPDVLTCCNMVDSHTFRQRAFSPALWILTPGARVSTCNALFNVLVCPPFLSTLRNMTVWISRAHVFRGKIITAVRSKWWIRSGVRSRLGRAARAERLLPQIFSVSSISLCTGEHVSMSVRISSWFQLSVQHRLNSCR